MNNLKQIFEEALEKGSRSSDHFPALTNGQKEALQSLEDILKKISNADIALSLDLNGKDMAIVVKGVANIRIPFGFGENNYSRSRDIMVDIVSEKNKFELGTSEPVSFDMKFDRERFVEFLANEILVRGRQSSLARDAGAWSQKKMP